MYRIYYCVYSIFVTSQINPEYPDFKYKQQKAFH